MICKKCGFDIGEAKFCTECGTKINEKDLEEINSGEQAVESAEDINLQRALNELQSFENGSIPDSNEEPEKKRNRFLYPKNPMLAASIWLFAFAAALGLIDFIFFSINIEGILGIVYRASFLFMALLVLFADLVFYFKQAIKLDKMFKGKGTLFEYKLKDNEIEEEAQKAKKKNRIFFLLISFFALAFSTYYGFLLFSAVNKSALLLISFVFSAIVFLVFILFFLFLPKLNYNRMKYNGAQVIIGEKSLYYGGRYYWWTKIEPQLTFGKYNDDAQTLTITFKKVLKSGKTQNRRVELFVPERELHGITNLLSLYETRIKEYKKAEDKNSILAGTSDND